MDGGRQNILLAASVAALFVSSTAYWVYTDTQPASYDSSWHLLVSKYYFDRLTGIPYPKTMGDNYPIFNHAVRSYPPIYMLTSQPLYMILGFSDDAGIMTNVIYYLLTVAVLYMFCKRHLNLSGFAVATLIMSSTPLYLGLSRFYLIDVALAFYLTLCIYLYIETGYFTKRAQTYAFALALYLATFTRYHAFILVVAPVVVHFLIYSRPSKESLKNMLPAFLAYAVLTAFSITYPAGVKDYYLMHLSQALTRQAADSQLSVFSWLMYYPIYSFAFLGPVCAVLFAFGARDVLKKRDPDLMVLLLFVASTVAFMSLVSFRDVRFMAPLIPSASLLASVGFSSFSPKTSKRLLVLVVIYVLVLMQPFYTVKNLPYYRSLSHKDYKVDEIVGYVGERVGERGGVSPSVGVFSTSSHVNPINLQYYFYLSGADISKVTTSNRGYSGFDYVVVGSKDNKLLLSKIAKDKKYVETFETKLADGSNAYVFERVRGSP